MAWTTPKTWVAGAPVLEGQLNVHIRDNLLQTMPGCATTAGDYFVTTGLNGIARRAMSVSTVATSQTTTSSSYVDLTTVGPSISTTTGALALCVFMARIDSTPTFILTGSSYMSVTASTVFTKEVIDLWASIYSFGRIQDAPLRMMSAKLFTTLTPGANTFTCKYRGDGNNTATFSDRTLIVIPL